MTAPGNTQSSRDADPAETAAVEQPGQAAGNRAADPAETATAQGEPANAEERDPAEVLAELESAQEALAEARDEALRARAEMENVRRRAEQEIAKARKFAVEGFASEMLQVKDSLDLAANVSLEGVESAVVQNMHEGLALTRRQLDSVFEKFGIATVDPDAGEKLNPDLHQAMSVQESADVPPGHILQVIQKGFTLNDRLLRPAMVIVAKAPAA